MRRVLAAVALAASACSTVPPRIGTNPPEELHEDAEAKYQKTFLHYSDHAEIYLGFDTVMFAGATFQSLPFREARARRQGDFQAWPEPKLQAALAQEQAEFAQTNRFFLGAHLNDYHFDDFDRSNSVWRIALVTPNGELTPVKVTRVGRADLNLRAYYSYMGTFWDAYVIDFPKTDASGAPVIPPTADTVVLRIASSLGKAEFKVAAH